MWNDHRSVMLSKLSIVMFSGGLLGVALFAPRLVHWLLALRPHLEGTEAYFLATIYTGCIPAAMLLYSMFRLLQNITAKEVFLTTNVEHLRRISWSCFAGASICLISVFYYIPWVLLAVSAGFMGLIVRVVKNVVAQAVSLQQEVDYTV